MFDLQKAGLGKRIAALLLDLIIFSVLATGIGYVISSVTGYSDRSAAIRKTCKGEKQWENSARNAAVRYLKRPSSARNAGQR